MRPHAAVRAAAAAARPPLRPLSEIRPKFSFPPPSADAAAVRAGRAEGEVSLAGWLHRKPKRLARDLTFAQLRDPQGNVVQLVDTESPSRLRALKPDSVLAVRGTVRPKRDAGDPAEPAEPGSSAAEFDLHVSDVQILSAANLLPGQLALETKDWPPQHRVIQLRQPEHQRVLRARSQIFSACRRVLEDAGFTEVETPLLFKSTPEGAREFLVPTRRRGRMYALPQSPQQYKQLLMASGIDRYYQIARCFRDEDLRQDRQPEFTQLDLEMAFSGARDVKAVVEQIVRTVWSKFGPTELATLRADAIEAVGDAGLGSLAYADAIARFGIDKPDLRSSLEITRLPGTAKQNPGFSVAEALVLRKGAAVLGEKAAVLLGDQAEYKARVPRIFVAGQDTADLQAALAEIGPDAADALGTLEDGDIVALSDRAQGFGYENPTPLGRLRQIVNEAAPTAYRRTDESVAVWVEKFPLFEPEVVSDGDYPVYNTQKLRATHHPFTMVALEDYESLNTDPLACHGQHYDLVVDGVELGGGSARIHDPELQLYIFEHILGIKDPRRLFGHLLDAFATGCPPHAGLAIGLDRMVAMLCGLRSIRSVIAFPKNFNGVDPIIESPSAVTDAQLAAYHIKPR